MKQETLEEAVSKFFDNKKYPTSLEIAEFGAKWQQETYNQFTLAMDDLKSSREGYLKAKEEYELKKQEKMYSEEDMEEYAEYYMECFRLGKTCLFVEEWFERFKKK